MTDATLATVQPEQPSAVALIREAMQAGQSPEYLRELLAVRREWEQDEGRKAFHRAMAAFQSRAPIIEKADQGEKSKYAKLDRIWRTVRPLLAELGLSVTWQISELRDGNLCHVEGKLAHRDGFSEKITFDVPIPDVIRTKDGRAVTNVAQQMGSAHSYAQRYATCAALGIVTGDDDDGHKAGAQFVTHDQAQELSDLIDACRGIAGFNEKAFWGWIGATVATEIAAGRYGEAKAALQKKLKG